MIEAPRSSETSVLTRTTRRNISVDDILRRTPLASRGWISSLTPRVRCGWMLIQRGSLGEEENFSHLKSLPFGLEGEVCCRQKISLPTNEVQLSGSYGNRYGTLLVLNGEIGNEKPLRLYRVFVCAVHRR
jgi:hypothetical protein